METFDLGVFGDQRCDDCLGPQVATRVFYGRVGWVEIATRHEPTCPQVRRTPCAPGAGDHPEHADPRSSNECPPLTRTTCPCWCDRLSGLTALVPPEITEDGVIVETLGVRSDPVIWCPRHRADPPDEDGA